MDTTIVSFEAACKAQGIDTDLPEVGKLPEKHRKAIIAYYMLIIIAAALNHEANGGKEWVPKYDGSEVHYYPFFYRGDDNGSGFRFYRCDFLRHRLSTVGSRLEFISEDVAEYAAETFIDLYRDAHMIQSEIAFPAAQG